MKRRNPPRRSFVALIASFALAAIALTGCASTGATQLPADEAQLTVAIKQDRFDYGTTTLSVSVTNESTATTELRSITLEYDNYQGPGTWSRADAYDIAPAQTTSFRVAMPTANCDAKKHAPNVTLEFRRNDREIRARFENVPDVYSQMDRVHAEDCLLSNANAIARLEYEPELRVTGSGRDAVATIGIRITPTGAAESMTIERVDSTVLLEQSPSPARAVALTIDASSIAQTLELSVVPSRCDAHVIAEDKIGTHVPVWISLNGAEASRTTLVPNRQLRAALLGFVAHACGLE